MSNTTENKEIAVTQEEATAHLKSVYVEQIIHENEFITIEQLRSITNYDVNQMNKIIRKLLTESDYYEYTYDSICVTNSSKLIKVCANCCELAPAEAKRLKHEFLTHGVCDKHEFVYMRQIEQNIQNRVIEIISGSRGMKYSEIYERLNESYDVFNTVIKQLVDQKRIILKSQHYYLLSNQAPSQEGL